MLRAPTDRGGRYDLLEKDPRWRALYGPDGTGDVLLAATVAEAEEALGQRVQSAACGSRAPTCLQRAPIYGCLFVCRSSPPGLPTG